MSSISLRLYLDRHNLHICANWPTQTKANEQMNTNCCKMGKISEKGLQGVRVEKCNQCEMKLSGEVKVDKSLFGRKCKYPRGEHKTI